MSEGTDDIEQDELWGGDGSDLHEPVHAHVVAALARTDALYPPPVDELLHLGDPRERKDRDELIAVLGLTQEHVPDLVRMARDRTLFGVDEEVPEFWAPIHALHALVGFDVRAHLAELIPLFDLDSDWASDDLPEVLLNTGEAGLAALSEYVHDRERWIYGRMGAGKAIADIVEHQPELRERAIAILSDELAHADENDPSLNGSFVSSLLDIKAVEALPAIRAAFEQDAVDETIVGDWGEILKALEQPIDNTDPLVQRSHERWDAKRAEMFRLSEGVQRYARQLGQRKAAPAPSSSRKPSAAAKQKHKRKQAAASRKANKKRKR